MKKNILFLLLILVIVSASCFAGSNKKKYTIDAKKAYKMINKNQDNTDFVILDVRTPKEYNDGHIENAVNIDYYSDTFKADLEKLDKNKTYIVYCRSGNRSGKTISIMLNMDFKNLYDLGGINQWIKQGYKTVK